MPAIEQVRFVTFGDEATEVAERILAEVDAGRPDALSDQEADSSRRLTPSTSIPAARILASDCSLTASQKAARNGSWAQARSILV